MQNLDVQKKQYLKSKSNAIFVVTWSSSSWILKLRPFFDTLKITYKLTYLDNYHLNNLNYNKHNNDFNNLDYYNHNNSYKYNKNGITSSSDICRTGSKLKPNSEHSFTHCKSLYKLIYLDNQ